MKHLHKRMGRCAAILLAMALLLGMMPMSFLGADGGAAKDSGNAAGTVNEAYANDEVLALADSMEHAREIADAYGLALKSYAYGIAVLLAPDAEQAVAQSRASTISPMTARFLRLPIS